MESIKNLLLFRVWSIFLFVVPLVIALRFSLYIPAGIIAGVIITSFVFHISTEKLLSATDDTFAWLLVISNIILTVFGEFTYPHAYIAMALSPLAFLLYERAKDESYDNIHGWWHVVSVIITVFSLLTFIH